MYYLIYAGKSNIDWDEKELKSLLVTSRQNNSRVGISGILIHLKDRFIQLLEGPEHKVKECFLNITQDERHSKIIILLEGAIETRIFAGWHMGFESLDVEQLQKYTGYTDLEKLFCASNVTNESHPALIFLKLFYDKNRQMRRSIS